MNWVDLLIIILVLYFAIEGTKRGFFTQLIDILGFLVSLIAALTLYQFIAGLLKQFFQIPAIVASPIGFLIIWLVVETIFFASASRLIAKHVQKYIQKTPDRLLGFIPSTLNALLFSAFILLFAISLPIRPEIKKQIFDSKIGSVLVSKATILERPLNSIFGPIAKQSLTFLTVSPKEKGSIPLEYKATQLSNDFTAEQRMFTLVNEERVKRGYKALAWDGKLAEVGRAHSKDMFERSYFSHYSPEGKDVGDRLEEKGINYSLAGENLALAPDVARAHEGLMNSEGHKRNILDPAYSQIGIGVIDGGIYGKMFTQVFTN